MPTITEYGPKLLL